MAQPYEIAPRVWFGPADATYADPTRFTHIVNCEASIGATSNAALAHVGYNNFLFLKSYDEDTFEILKEHDDRVYAFITEALKDPKSQVYIHCYAGINRSATLAIAYACRALKRSVWDVLPATRKGTRRLVVANKGFERQLEQKYWRAD